MLRRQMLIETVRRRLLRLILINKLTWECHETLQRRDSRTMAKRRNRRRRGMRKGDNETLTEVLFR